ncbi:hypothetical protein IWX81_001830 [Salinibacterium sp. CAN_S4]
MDAADLPPATITAGSAAVFVAVLVVAVATVIATVPMPCTPVLAQPSEE